MTAIIDYHVMSDVSELPGIKATYTCEADGYTRAWQDVTNPLLVWIEATCPVDAVVSAMAATVTSSVTTHAAESNPDNLDAHTFIQKIILSVAVDVMTYVGASATQAVSVWIAQPSFLYPIIVAEMISQGVIASI